MKINALSHKQYKLIMAAMAIAAVVAAYLGRDDASPVVLVKDDVAMPMTAQPFVQPQASTIAVATMAHTQKATVNNTLAAHKRNAWEIGDLHDMTPTLPVPEKVVAYEPVAVNPHPDVFPQAGETLSVPMLNGKSVLVDVQSTTINPNGDFSWSGHLQDHGTDYPVIMTYGEHSVFAMVTTPEGSYTMESVDGVGWIYKNPSEFELSTPGTKDYIDVNPADLNK